jgi:hypothetical protein
MNKKDLLIVLLIVFVFLLISYEVYKESNPEFNLQNLIENLITKSSPSPSIQPHESPKINKDSIIRAKCTKEAKAFLNVNKENANEKQLLYTMNARYRICLAENGLRPEDLIAISESQAQPVQQKSNINNNYFDELCTEKIQEYNTCMAEYNAEMSEYNARLQRGETGWIEPMNFCIKPYSCY